MLAEKTLLRYAMILRPENHQILLADYHEEIPVIYFSIHPNPNIL
jgi:hypothetical protein